MEQEKSVILIVDDNIKNLQITGKVLRDEGYKICLAQNSREAFSLLESQNPNIILLDIMMPQMDGYETSSIIKKNEKWKDIPILFLTAKVQVDDIVKGFKHGGVDYITKPFNREELLVRVRNHLQIQASKRKIMEMSKIQHTMYSVIAHDLRSPFSNIAQMIDFIADGTIEKDSADFQRFINELQQRTHETSNLLDNLLFWAKMQNDKIAVFKDNIPIFFLIEETLGLLKGVITQKNIAVSNQVEKNMSISGDRILLSIIIRNIISNALKFTPGNGTITIGSVIANDRGLITFCDTGAGMLQEQINEVLLTDMHRSSLGTNNEQGSGLGFLLIKKFIALNGGHLNLYNNSPSGLCVEVSLPIAT